MARNLRDIIAHIRTVCENPGVKTTLIQTEDLLTLCREAEMPLGGMAAGVTTTASNYVLSCLEQRADWKEQSFEYYAAHFLVGSGLVGGDLDSNVRGLAAILKKQYDLGVQHGANAELAPA